MPSAAIIWGTAGHAKRAQIVLANSFGVVSAGCQRRAMRIPGACRCRTRGSAFFVDGTRIALTHDEPRTSGDCGRGFSVRALLLTRGWSYGAAGGRSTRPFALLAVRRASIVSSAGVCWYARHHQAGPSHMNARTVGWVAASVSRLRESRPGASASSYTRGLFRRFSACVAFAIEQAGY